MASMANETIRTMALTCDFCGAEGIRTPDPLHAMEVRYQLRYSPARPEGRTANVEDLTLPRR